MNCEKIIQSLKHNRYKVSCFETATAAADYIVRSVKNTTVGFGDSLTLEKMNLAQRLSEHNTVLDPAGHVDLDFYEVAVKTLTTDVYITSVNAAAETGELVNIDGAGNRVAGSLYGHKKVYFVFSTNKIEPTLDKAILRARNIAAPQNAKRLNYKTPCAVKGDRCYDCSSPNRICNTLNIYLKNMEDGAGEVIIVNEDLGL
ncbi:MAG: lactate utilization protein [Tindallia sp. MSAO_Bac2]|nr:MAG: lactate utilization protein [Tindallia sp. MSAO_Bac2]